MVVGSVEWAFVVEPDGERVPETRELSPVFPMISHGLSLGFFVGEGRTGVHVRGHAAERVGHVRE